VHQLSSADTNTSIELHDHPPSTTSINSKHCPCLSELAGAERCVCALAAQRTDALLQCEQTLVDLSSLEAGE
jgi:hypothetical protein